MDKLYFTPPVGRGKVSVPVLTTERRESVATGRDGGKRGGQKGKGIVEAGRGKGALISSLMDCGIALVG